MNKIVLCLLTFIITINNVSAQECNCTESFDWMVSIFENNDAGFQYVIDKKGIDDYKKHTALFKEKAKNATTVKDCQKLMLDWLHYFRPGHIYISVKETGVKSSNVARKQSDEEIRLQYKNEKTLNLTEKTLINILEKKQQINPIEGIWSDGNYTLGIIGDEKSSKKFTAFIIKADSIYWVPKQIKAEFTLNNDNQSYTLDYYKRDHSKQAPQTIFINNSGTTFETNASLWTKKYPKVTLSKKIEIYLAFSKSANPFVEKLSDKTVYLRIPSFNVNRKKEIDDILLKYHDLITSTPNLIIDIRNGTGGGSASYEKIIPYFYTNPIRYIGIQLNATELNAKAFEMYAKEYEDTARINYFNSIAARMRSNIGKFISLWEKPYQIDSLETVLPYPQKVAIICNQYNGSADEQFLLSAKQSGKVKVFGRPTSGQLDISNLNDVDSPDGKFTLSYGMSRSYRIPSYCIDGVGIQPDYFIDDAISESDWIEYTKMKIEE